MVEMAALHLPLRPGTDIALLNALAHVLVANGWIDRAFIEARTENFDASRSSRRPRRAGRPLAVQPSPGPDFTLKPRRAPNEDRARRLRASRSASEEGALSPYPPNGATTRGRLRPRAARRPRPPTSGARASLAPFRSLQPAPSAATPHTRSGVTFSLSSYRDISIEQQHFAATVAEVGHFSWGRGPPWYPV